MLQELSEDEAPEFFKLVDADTASDVLTELDEVTRERLIDVWNTPVDVEPTQYMCFFRYEDRPGIIGAVGTGFGEAGVNIAAAQVGRSEVGGEAIMALSLDDAVPDDILARLVERIGATRGRSITLV